MSWKVILTHLSAVAVGWACADRILDSRDSKPESNASSVRTKAGERQASVQGNPADKGPLARWTGNVPDPAMVERLKHESVAEVADGLFDESADMEASELLRLVSVHEFSEFKATIAGLGELWRAEPKEMLEWFKALPPEKKQKFAILLMDTKLASSIPDDQLDEVDGTESHIQWLPKERGRRAGKAGDMAYLERMLQEVAAKQSDASSSLLEVIANWPVDQLDPLVARIRKEKNLDLNVLRKLCDRLPMSRRPAFLDSLTAENGSEARNGWLMMICNFAARDCVGMDLEKRLNYVGMGNEEYGKSMIPQLINTDIQRLFSDDGLYEDKALGDALEKVGKGGMKAEELLVEITSRLGKLAEGQEDLVREKVFQQLAKSAPGAAAELMSGSSVKTVQDKALSLGFDSAGFEAAANVLRARDPEAPNELQNRFSGWGHKSYEGLARFGDAYVSWALAMPRSLDRDLVLSAIALHVEKEDPERAARLRAEKSFQSGWRPGMK